jgi:hypothetical protein
MPSATITKTPEKSPRNVLKTIQQNPTSAVANLTHQAARIGTLTTYRASCVTPPGGGLSPRGRICALLHLYERVIGSNGRILGGIDALLHYG